MTSKIKNAVTKAIHNLFGDDYAVYTAYTEQGFSEPCFIVEMFPLNVQSTNSFLDDETQTVRIRYVPKDISQDEFIDVAEKLRGLFLTGHPVPPAFLYGKLYACDGACIQLHR